MHQEALIDTASAAPKLSKTVLLAALTILALLTYAFYARILSFFFTGADTLFHIDYSRISSSADFLRIMTGPHLGDD